MKARVYGLLAEFDSPKEILTATRRAYLEGYRKMDAYTPFPVHDLADALGMKRTAVPFITLLGGILGGGTAYALQWWINTIAYPINIAGRPLHSWPSFIVVTFEMTVLFAGLAAFIGSLALNGLPMPHHPIFNSEEFSAASRDKFFLCIEATDPRFDRTDTERFLQTLNARAITEVPN
jgi:Alternative complex III, ActD subunit